MTQVAIIKLIVVTRITNISNSYVNDVTPFPYVVRFYSTFLYSTSKLFCSFSVGIVRQNCFAHSMLVLMALFMALSNIVKGPIRSNTII